MAITYIDSWKEGLGILGGTTTPVDTTGANLIVVAVFWYPASTPTLSDSKGNTWVSMTAYDQGSTIDVRFFYCLNPTVGSGHTFTLGGSTQYSGLAVSWYSGVKTSAAQDQLSGNGASATTVQAGSVTPSEDNELILSALAEDAVITKSIDSGFTKIQDLAKSAGSYVGGALAHKIQTAAGAENPTWTVSGSTNLVATNISFKAAPGADEIPPDTVTGLTATKISNAQVDIDSDPGTDNVGVDHYITERKIDSGSFVELTPTTKAFSDTEDFPTTPGTYSFTYRRKAVDAAGNVSASYSSVTTPVSITISGPPVPDPVYRSNIQNGRGILRFSGECNALLNESTFYWRHLWIVAKYAGAAFDGEAGLITDLDGWGGLIGVDGGTVFQSLLDLLPEINWRSFVNGVEVDPAAIPAPMNAFKLIEVRADAPVFMDGLSLGRDRAGGIRWTGDFGEMFFSQKAQLITDCREIDESLMTKWGLS